MPKNACMGQYLRIKWYGNIASPLSGLTVLFLGHSYQQVVFIPLLKALCESSDSKEKKSTSEQIANH